jgi:putative membrane protein
VNVSATDGWVRLHPLSPVLRMGRLVLPAVLITAQTTARGGPGGVRWAVFGGLVAVGTVAGLVSWLVTRWRIEDGTLRIETGLVRRDKRQIPLSRLQAIDIVRPLLGRLLGLSELRLRLAGSHHGDARLAYLGEGSAEALRARLLALAHGLAEETPAPPERPLFQLTAQRLLASTALSGVGLTAAVLLVAGVAVVAFSPAAAGGFIGPALGFGVGAWRRVNSEFDFLVAEAPDGLRLRAGLLETRAETIPYGRVQAVRILEPLLWRPAGWCRVEVDVAGQGHVRRGDESGVRVTRALLPVGSREQAITLVARVMPWPLPASTRPPARARVKSPLRYHYLAAGYDPRCAITQSGRVRRATDVLPLSKVQSIRWVQGPVQRRLRLATLHLDTAGRNVHAVLRDRDMSEAETLLRDLPIACRAARQHDGSPGDRGAAPV